MAGADVASWKAFYRRTWTNYGITPAQYRGLYLAQLGRCYVCRRAKGIHPDDPQARGPRRLGVDHNHVLGNRVQAVRALVCTWGDKSCNRILGWLDAEGLDRAAGVLRHAPAQWALKLMDEGMDEGTLTGVLTR